MREGTRLELTASFVGVLCLLASACGSGGGIGVESPDGAVSAGGAGATGTTTHASGGATGMPSSSAQGAGQSRGPDAGILVDAGPLSDARLDVARTRDADRDRDSGALSDAEIVLYGLTAGPYCFKVTSVAAVMDGCDLGVGNLVGLFLPGSYDTGTGIFTLGTFGSLGSGAIRYNRGTLQRPKSSASDSDLPGCYWNQADTTLLTMTDTNKFTVSVTEDQEAIALACGMTMTSCTSTWTWTMETSGPQTTTGMCP